MRDAAADQTGPKCLYEVFVLEESEDVEGLLVHQGLQKLEKIPPDVRLLYNTQVRMHAQLENWVEHGETPENNYRLGGTQPMLAGQMLHLDSPLVSDYYFL